MVMAGASSCEPIARPGVRVAQPTDRPPSGQPPTHSNSSTHSSAHTTTHRPLINNRNTTTLSPTCAHQSKRNAVAKLHSPKSLRSQSLTGDTYLEKNSIENQCSMNLSMVPSICLENLRDPTDVRSGEEKIEQIEPTLPCDLNQMLPVKNVGESNNLCLNCLNTCVVKARLSQSEASNIPPPSNIRTHINFIENVDESDSVFHMKNVLSVMSSILLSSRRNSLRGCSLWRTRLLTYLVPLYLLFTVLLASAVQANEGM